MPLYDIRCIHCEGIFEKLVSMQALHGDVTCPYCRQSTVASPILTGGRVIVQVKYRWQPRNGAEQLAGQNVTGPGTHTNSPRGSVLHNCKGYNCSICGN